MWFHYRLWSKTTKKKNKNQKSKNTTLFFLQSGACVLCRNPNSTPGPACGAAELNAACCLPCPRPGTEAVFPKETQRKGELHGLPTDTTLPASQAQLQPEILPKEPGIGFTVSSSDHQKPRGAERSPELSWPFTDGDEALTRWFAARAEPPPLPEQLFEDKNQRKCSD